MMRRLIWCAVVIAAGLSIRGFGPAIGLPAHIVKYGGSILWATMVYLVVALGLPAQRRRTIAVAAMAITIGVEAFRLYHSPWLDAFRLTLPGALLLGRIFSSWNIIAYAAGIAFGVAIDAGGADARPIPQRWMRS